RLYLDGNTSVALLLGLIYLRGAAPVMLLGLLLLAVGAVMLAMAMVRSGVKPRWAVSVYAAGLALWCPLFPSIVRIIDGLLIGIGGLALAWMLGRSPVPQGGRPLARA